MRWLLLAYAPLMPFPAEAVECNDSLVPSSSNTPYVLRQNRCEGFYALREASDATLTLIGFVRGRLEYQLDQAEKIILRVPSDLPREYDPIRITALPFSVDMYYQLDSEIGRDEALEWPVKDVLWPERISAAQINVFGSYRHPGGDGMRPYDVRVPLLVESGVIASADDHPHLILLSASQDIDYLSSEWQCENQPAAFKERTEDLHASLPIPVFPPRKLRGLCHVLFIGILKERDSGGWGNQVKLNLLLHLGNLPR